jgi:putative protease
LGFVYIKDGNDNLVLADMGCRNTVFNARSQSAAPYLDWFARAGYDRFRIEFVDEPADCVGRVIDSYVNVLDLAFAKEGHLNSDGDSVSPGASDDAYWSEVDSLLKVLEEIPDANGRTFGFSEGSLKPSEERKWSSLRPTAATQRSSGRV